MCVGTWFAKEHSCNCTKIYHFKCHNHFTLVQNIMICTGSSLNMVSIYCSISSGSYVARTYSIIWWARIYADRTIMCSRGSCGSPLWTIRSSFRSWGMVTFTAERVWSACIQTETEHTTDSDPRQNVFKQLDFFFFKSY